MEKESNGRIEYGQCNMRDWLMKEMEERDLQAASGLLEFSRVPKRLSRWTPTKKKRSVLVNPPLPLLPHNPKTNELWKENSVQGVPEDVTIEPTTAMDERPGLAHQQPLIENDRTAEAFVARSDNHEPLIHEDRTATASLIETVPFEGNPSGAIGNAQVEGSPSSAHQQPLMETDRTAGRDPSGAEDNGDVGPPHRFVLDPNEPPFQWLPNGPNGRVGDLCGSA